MAHSDAAVLGSAGVASGLALALVIVCPLGVALAESDDRLAYRASPPCPSKDAFRLAVASRAPRKHLESLDIDIEVHSVDGGYRGTLGIDEPWVNHSVDAAKCDEVVDALALLVTLVLDQSGSAPQADDPAITDADEVSQTTAPAAKDSFQPPPTPPPTSSANAVTATPHRDRPTLSPGAARIQPPQRGSTLRIGMHAASVNGVVPGHRVAPHVFAEIDAAIPIRLVAARASGSTTIMDGAGSAALAWTAARLDGCPFAHRDRIELTLCGSVEAGWVRASGRDLDDAATHRGTWFALGSTARAGLPLGRVSIEIETAATAPVVRNHYRAMPSVDIYRPAAVGWRLGIGLALSIW